MRSSKVIASVAALALLASSTAAAAAAPKAAAPVVQPQAPNAWMMLSVLSPTRSVALGGANAAVQPADAPPPPPPYGATGGPVITGELVGILLWFALIAIALTISDNGGRPNSPNSPA